LPNGNTARCAASAMVKAAAEPPTVVGAEGDEAN
jgi:hypothetical protein